MKHKLLLFFFLSLSTSAICQLNTNRIMDNGRYALYYEDYFLSIQYFNQVIKVKPYLAEPYIFRGWAKLYLDEYPGAENDCTQALELNPFLPDAYTCRAYARLSQEKYSEAADDFTKAIEFSPNRAGLYTARGTAYAALNENDKALDDYMYALKRDSKNIYTYYEMGKLHFAMNDTIAALNDFTKITEIDRFNPAGYSARGLIYLKNGEYEKAVADFDSAISLQENAGDYLNRALAKYHLINLRGAMADYDKALELNPNEFLAYFNRGLLRAYIGDNNLAIEDFNMVLQFNPNEYAALVNRAMLRLETGDLYGAIEDINQIIEKNPEFSQAYYMRSEAKAKLGRKKEAELDYMTAYYLDGKEREKSPKQREEEAKTRNEEDNDINNYKKIIVINTEKEKEKQQYKNNELRGNIQNINIEIQPEANFFLSYYSPEKKIKTSMIHYNKDVEEINKRLRLDETLKITNEEIKLSNDLIVMHLSMINEWSKQIEANNSNADAYYIRALNFSLVQDYENAIDNFNKAIALKANEPLYYFSRAYVRYRMLNYEQASMELTVNKEMKSITNDIHLKSEYELIVRDYSKAIELAPGFIYAYFNRANLFFNSGDFTAAIRDYNAAIKAEPDYAEAYYNRGLAYILTGDKQKGLIDLGKAGELGIHTAYNIIKRYS